MRDEIITIAGVRELQNYANRGWTGKIRREMPDWEALLDAYIVQISRRTGKTGRNLPFEILLENELKNFNPSFFGSKQKAINFHKITKEYLAFLKGREIRDCRNRKKDQDFLKEATLTKQKIRELMSHGK